MMERYTRLSPAHKLEAVQRLARAAADARTGTPTGTETESMPQAAEGGGRKIESARRE
jgi:hypothetical protein